MKELKMIKRSRKTRIHIRTLSMSSRASTEKSEYAQTRLRDTKTDMCWCRRSKRNRNKSKLNKTKSYSSCMSVKSLCHIIMTSAITQSGSCAFRRWIAQASESCASPDPGLPSSGQQRQQPPKVFLSETKRHCPDERLRIFHRYRKSFHPHWWVCCCRDCPATYAPERISPSARSQSRHWPPHAGCLGLAC